MSLFARLRLSSHCGFSGEAFLSRGQNLVRSVIVTRGFAQPALKSVEEEVEEIEIDPRRLPADYDPATFDPTEHRSPPTERVWRLVEEISSLKLVELHDLKQILMRKMNMTEDPVIAVMKPGAAGLAGAMRGSAAAAKEEKKVEKTVFELKLETFDVSTKVKVIKEVRTFTDLGLKEAKELVEKAPAVFKKGVSKEEAEKIIEKMKTVGAKVIME